MAAVSTDQKTKRRKVQFTGLDLKRRTLWLGKCSLKDAVGIAGHVEEILTAATLNRAMAQATADWLAGLKPTMLRKLVKAELVLPCDNAKLITLGEFLDAYLARRKDVKNSTAVFYRNTQRNLIEVFGADRTLVSITPADADDFRRALQQRGDADNSNREADTLGVKLFDVAAVVLNDTGRLARALKAQWLKSPKLPKQIGKIYQSRRSDLYSLAEMMAFVK